MRVAKLLETTLAYNIQVLSRKLCTRQLQKLYFGRNNNLEDFLRSFYLAKIIFDEKF